MFNTRVKVKELLSATPESQQVTVMGWVRSFRNNQFIALNDGSTNNNIQVVAELGVFEEELLKKITPGASLKVTGRLVASQGKGQAVEVKAIAIADFKGAETEALLHLMDDFAVLFEPDFHGIKIGIFGIPQAW